MTYMATMQPEETYTAACLHSYIINNHAIENMV